MAKRQYRLDFRNEDCRLLTDLREQRGKIGLGAVDAGHRLEERFIGGYQRHVTAGGTAVLTILIPEVEQRPA